MRSVVSLMIAVYLSIGPAMVEKMLKICWTCIVARVWAKAEW